MTGGTSAMLQACLNGGRSKAEAPAVPITPAELAADALAVRAAGAHELHLHPRDASGEESLAPSDVAAALDEVRRVVPAMPIGIGTGAWIKPGGRARLELVARWHSRPDYASVNLNEADAPATMELLLAMGVGIEAGIWTVRDAERFVALPLAPRCLRVLLEMTAGDGDEAAHEYRACKHVLDRAGLGLPILLHGEAESVWPMARLARLDGHQRRIGFEDGLHLPDGSVAPSNAALVAAAMAADG